MNAADLLRQFTGLADNQRNKIPNYNITKKSVAMESEHFVNLTRYISTRGLLSSHARSSQSFCKQCRFWSYLCSCTNCKIVLLSKECWKFRIFRLPNCLKLHSFKCDGTCSHFRNLIQLKFAFKFPDPRMLLWNVTHMSIASSTISARHYVTKCLLC